jgi:tetratricopeptide (TPR) repeat protein
MSITLWIQLFCFTLTPTSGLWEEANQAYQDGNFEQAVTAYEELLNTGLRNGVLHYNLGNAYLKTENVGEALLHYYKAQRYMPNDADLLANIQIADQMRQDPEIEEEAEVVPPVFVSLVTILPYTLTFSLAALLLLIGGLVSLLLVFRPSTGKWAGYVLVLNWTFGLILMGMAFFQHHHLTRDDFAVILEEKVDVYAGPTQRESINFTIHEGIRCQILESEPGWYRIRLANGYNGWVPRTSLERI